MGKWTLLFALLCFITTRSVAEDPPALIGWHWYNAPVKHPRKKRRPNALMNAFHRLSAQQQLTLLQRATNNLKAKAILSGTVADISAYKKAQDFWIARATRFTVGWEQMLLAHPELNYSLQFPHENALASISQHREHAQEAQAVTQLAKTNGLLFFYRGKNKGDQFFSTIVQRYARRYQLSVLPVSVDGVLSHAFPVTRHTKGRANARRLGIRYFPALVLVNPETHQHALVSYGFKSEDELSERLLRIADGWKAGF